MKKATGRGFDWIDLDVLHTQSHYIDHSKNPGQAWLEGFVEGGREGYITGVGEYADEYERRERAQRVWQAMVASVIFVCAYTLGNGEGYEEGYEKGRYDG